MADDDINAHPHALQASAASGSCCNAPVLDEDRYRTYVEDLSLTPEQEDTLLRTLWWMMSTFVDLGFGLDSVQNAFDAVADGALPDELDSLQLDQGLEVRETLRQITVEAHKKGAPQ